MKYWKSYLLVLVSFVIPLNSKQMLNAKLFTFTWVTYLTAQSLTVACLAGETILFKTVNSYLDAQLLQQDLDRLNLWSKSSGPGFSELKTKSKSISRPKVPIKHL